MSDKLSYTCLGVGFGGEVERWYGCPLCGRSARTSRELTAQGCEGKHVPLIDLHDLEAWLEEQAEGKASEAEGQFSDERYIPEGEEAAYRAVLEHLRGEGE